MNLFKKKLTTEEIQTLVNDTITLLRWFKVNQVEFTVRQITGNNPIIKISDFKSGDSFLKNRTTIFESLIDSETIPKHRLVMMRQQSDFELVIKHWLSTGKTYVGLP